MSTPSRWPTKPSPRDGPHGGAPEAQPHAPDSLPPQTVVGSSCTPLSNKGATTETTEVIEPRSKPIEPVELSEADARKVQEAFVLLREETAQGHVDHDVPVLLNIISTLLHGPILAQVTFPTGDPEEALAKALLLQRLVANSSGGADFVVKLQQSKLLMTTSSSPTPLTVAESDPTQKQPSGRRLTSTLCGLQVATRRLKGILTPPATWRPVSSPMLQLARRRFPLLPRTRRLYRCTLKL